MSKVVSADLETHLFGPGRRAPTAVVAGVHGDTISATAMLPVDYANWLESALADHSIIHVNHNQAYDMGVTCANFPHLTNEIFAAYADDRIGCTMLLTHLHDIAVYGTNKGGKVRLDKNYEDHELDDEDCISEEKEDAKSNPTRYMNLGRYSLQALAQRFLNVHLEKDEWRMRYAELDGLPLEEFPEGSLDYVKSDAIAAYGLWNRVVDSAKQRGVPIDNVFAQSRGQFGLFLATCSGLYTDPVYVQELRTAAETFRAEAKPLLLEKGFIRPEVGLVIWEYHTVTTATRDGKNAYLRAKGLPNNNAKTRSKETRPVTRRILDILGRKGQEKTLAAVGEPMWHALHKLGIWKTKVVKRNSGRRWPCDRMIASDGPAREYAEEIDARTDLRLPRTEKGSIRLNPATAELVNDPLLNAFIEWKRTSSVMAEIERLERGLQVPIHAEYRTLKETGRTSSGGGEAGINIQNRRRAHGYREVFIPEKGCALVSIDYSQIELCALAQVQYDWFGKSAMRDVINAGRDCHVTIAAKLAGVNYTYANDSRKGKLSKHEIDWKIIPDWAYKDVYKKQESEARKAGLAPPVWSEEGLREEANKHYFKQLRTLAKALNFGLPGGLGELKFRQFAKQTYGVDVLASAFSLKPLEGYVPIELDLCPTSLFIEHLSKELRVKASKETWYNGRGEEKTVAYEAPDGSTRVPAWWVFEQSETVYVLDKSFTHLRAEWFQIYPEMPLYFDRVKEIRSQHGNTITQHKTGRMRARTTYCSASNSFFQGLVADGAKEAVFRLQRAAFTDDWGPDVLRGCPVKIFVHDECVLQVPLDRLHSASYAASRIMVETMKEFIPDVLVEAEPAAMLRWTKSADSARFDLNGLLIPEEVWRLKKGKIAKGERDEYLSFIARHQLDEYIDSIEC